MRILLSALIFIVIMSSCQQQRLINFRNLTLVEGEAPQEHPEKESEFVKTDFAETGLNDSNTDLIEENASHTETYTNREEQGINQFEQTTYPEDHISDTRPIIENDLVLHPRTVQDSTKTDSKKMSKKDAGKIMGIAGGITILALLFFIFLGLLGVLFVVLILWTLVSGFVF